MEIFLGAEIDGLASGKWFCLQKEFTELLSQLESKNYGDNLNSIAVISIVLHDDFFECGGYKERKYYSKSKKSADIRLRLNYKAFVNSNEVSRRELYINHILDAIQIAGTKAGNDFDLNSLLSDVKRLLSGQGDKETFLLSPCSFKNT